MEFNNITLEETEPIKGRPRKYNFIEIPVDQQPPQESIERKTKEKYHSQYYQNHKEIKVLCPICKKAVQKYSLGKHQRTQYCQLVKKNLEDKLKEKEKAHSLSLLVCQLVKKNSEDKLKEKENVHFNNESTF